MGRDDDGTGKRGKAGATGAKAGSRRSGLPDPASIVSVKTLISPKGNRYRVIRTTDKDPYDEEEGKSNDRPVPDKNRR